MWVVENAAGMGPTLVTVVVPALIDVSDDDGVLGLAVTGFLG